MRKVEMMVPIPATAPLMLLTLATDSGRYRSAGNVSTIVDHAAYEKVAIAKQVTMAGRLATTTVGISISMPAPPSVITSLRAATTPQPSLMQKLESPPPAKFPISAAMNGIQNRAACPPALSPSRQGRLQTNP